MRLSTEQLYEILDRDKQFSLLASYFVFLFWPREDFLKGIRFQKDRARISSDFLPMNNILYQATHIFAGRG